MGTDWTKTDEALPHDMIRAGVPILPISDLEPIVHTSINCELRLDCETALSQNPLYHHPLCTDSPQLVVFGELETPDFHRQADIYAKRYRTPMRRLDHYTVPNVDHFDIITELGDARSELFDRVATLTRA